MCTLKHAYCVSIPPIGAPKAAGMLTPALENSHLWTNKELDINFKVDESLYKVKLNAMEVGM